MVQRVEAWGNILEFPDNMSDDDMASAIRKNESSLNPDYKPDSTLDKVKSMGSKAVDAGLSLLTPKKSIADQAEEKSRNDSGLAPVSGVPIRRDYYNKVVADTPAGSASSGSGIADRVKNAAAQDVKAQNAKRTVARAALSTEPVPEEGGFVNSAARTVGQTVKGAGQVASDFLGADRNNAVTRYGQSVIDANPTAVNSLEDIADKPGTAITEATGNAAPSMAGMVGARAIGQGIAALSPLAGPAAPVVAGLGQVVSWLGPAAIASLPSYGGIRDKQILNDPKNEQSAKAKAIAALGAGAVGAIEQAFGPQQWAMAALTKEGRSALAKKFAATTLPGAAGKAAFKGALAEGSEELAQNPIEQLASFDDPTTKESIKDTLFSGAMGAIGGGVLGGGTGAVTHISGKPVTEVSDRVLRYTANRGGERAKAAAQAELNRRATEGVDPEVANAPESTSEAVDRIIATGREKADEIRSARADAIQDSIFDEEPENEAGNAPVAQSQPLQDTPTPEPIQTLNAQINALAEGRKPGVLLTPNEPMPDTLPEGVQAAEIPGRGILLYRDEAALRDALDGRMGEALGYGIDEKPADATQVVTARNPNGTVIQDVATDGRPEVERAAAAVAGPGGTVETRSVQDVMAERGANAKQNPSNGFEKFHPASGTLGIPRSEMPQVPTQSHGGLVNHLNAQGIAHKTKMVSTNKLKPTQAEFSPEKVKKAKKSTSDRAVIVSNDGHIIDGHHQALAAHEEGRPVKAIVLDAPVDKALEAVRNSPSAQSLENDQAAHPIRPLVESLIKRRAAAKQSGKERSINNAIARAKEVLEGKRTDAALESKWFRVQAAGIQKADPATAEILKQIGDRVNGGKLESRTHRTMFERYASLGTKNVSAEQSLIDAEDITGLRIGLTVEYADLPEHVPARFDPSRRIIEVSNKREGFRRGYGALIMAEELLHAVDALSSDRTLSASSKRLNLQTGDIAMEVIAHADSKGAYGPFFYYPLGYSDLTDTVKEAELFARLGVLYFGEPERMRQSLPLAYGAFNEIFSLAIHPVSGELSKNVWSFTGGASAHGGKHRTNGRTGAGNGKSAEGGQRTELGRLRAAIWKSFKADPLGGEVDFRRLDTRSFKTRLQAYKEKNAKKPFKERLQTYKERQNDDNGNADELRNRAAKAKSDSSARRLSKSVQRDKSSDKVLKDDDPKFSKERIASVRKRLKTASDKKKQATRRGGLSVSEVEKLIAPLQQAGFKKINIAATQNDLPQQTLDQIKSQKARFVRGVYIPSTDEIWLVADQLNDALDVALVAMHEARHRGLRKMFGPEIDPIMRQIYLTNKRVRDIADRKIKAGMSKELAVEETLADLPINRARELNGWKKLIRFIKEWIAKKLDLTFTDEMVEQLVASAEIVGMSEDEVSLFDESKAEAIRDASGGAVFSQGSNASWDAPEPSRIDDLIHSLQNKHIDLKRVTEAIRENAGQLAEKFNTYLQEELFHGRTAKRTKDFVNEELKPLIGGLRLRGLSVEELDKYLHARHAQEANALIASRDPNMLDGGSGMTNQEARDYFKGLDPEKKRKLEQVAKKVDDIIAETRDLYLSYGLIDQATYDSWESMFKHYVPLMREDKDGGMGIGQGFSIKGKEAKHRTGSRRAVVDILANIALQRERAIVRGEKNRVAVSLYGLAKLNPNEEFWTTENVPQRHYDEATGQVVERADPRYKERKNVVVSKIVDSKGRVTERAVIFNENDPRAMRMAAALKNLDVDQLSGLMGVSAMITRYFASINTQYNPVFGVVNLVRDQQAALLNLSSTPIAGQRMKVLAQIIPAIRAIYASSRGERKGKQSNSAMSALWDEMQSEGGMTGYRDLFKTSEDRAKAIQRELDPTAWMNSGLGKIFTAGGMLKVPLAVAQKKAGWLFDWLSDYNQTLEGATRLAAYKVALDKGLSKQQAASVAKNLTVNFNRKGSSAQQAGALYAFFNAAMQGTARIGETMFDMDKGDIKTLRLNRAGKNIIAGGVTLGVMQALALSAAGFDDDDPPEFVRERSLIIPVGDKKYITIPMPLGFNVIPNIGRISMEFAMGGFKKPAEHTVQLIGLFAEAFNPIGNAGLSIQTLAPTAIDPFVALSENRDWTGKPIAKEDFNKLSPTPGFSRNKDTASDPAKWIAEAINTISGGNKYVPGVASPTADQLDYLWGQATGGVGREASKLNQTISSIGSGEDLPPHKIPLVGRFYGDSSSSSSQGNKFYSNLKRINEVEAELKGRIKDKLPVDEFKAENPEYRLITAANYTERAVSNLRRRKSDLIEKDEPKEQVKAIEDRITQLMKRMNDRVKEVRTAP